MNATNQKLLTRLYQDTKIGSLGTANVQNKCTNEKFKQLLFNQKEQYDALSKECEKIALEYGIKLTDNNFLKKMRQKVMINFSLFFDDTDRHIAEMMITGTVMGVIDCIKALYDLKKADETILKLGEKVRATQEKYVEDLKAYLEG